MNKQERVFEALEARQKAARSAWCRGVLDYAFEMADSEELVEAAFEGYKLQDFKLETIFLNGASCWKEYSYSGNALCYDWDIAERLCTPSELARLTHKDGSLADRPNARETWLDCQARALYQAFLELLEVIRSEGARA